MSHTEQSVTMSPPLCNESYLAAAPAPGAGTRDRSLRRCAPPARPPAPRTRQGAPCRAAARAGAACSTANLQAGRAGQEEARTGGAEPGWRYSLHEHKRHLQVMLAADVPLGTLLRDVNTVADMACKMVIRPALLQEPRTEQVSASARGGAPAPRSRAEQRARPRRPRSGPPGAAARRRRRAGARPRPPPTRAAAARPAFIMPSHASCATSGSLCLY